MRLSCFAGVDTAVDFACFAEDEKRSTHFLGLCKSCRYIPFFGGECIVKSYGLGIADCPFSGLQRMQLLGCNLVSFDWSGNRDWKRCAGAVFLATIWLPKI